MADPHPPVYEVHFTRTPFQLLAGAGWKRLVAFRVDSAGILLGGAPARYEAQTAFVPWEDITSVVLWQQQMAGPSMNYVGVHRRPGAPPLPGMNSRLGPDQTAELAPHVEHELFLASRPINLWRLDPERLQAAVDTFAPRVPVLAYQQKETR
ncbi:hypothetical protein [Streptomyces sp. XD-27]|uniref:hypothetical protein n=1 Tax=Streptomyces sp. XD-27 TaxID=3062779 RepID=UPI0026F40DCA|nr:hypothetical protein [Streptomyces sp. XD-27]WKX68735.1 hypothetical protein Q3Y56_01215 [Streptomyces sp. XD-27]